jgi:tetratricopeptide (TPR) repeat protein
MTTEELVQRGRECEAAGDLDGAEAAYREADAGGDAEGAILLGLVLKQRGDHSGSADALRRSESRGHPEAGGCLGNLLADTGDIERAKAAYQRSIDAGSKLARLNLGLTLAEQGATDEALPHLRIADENGEPAASWAIGKILEDRGDLQGAIPAYRRGADGGIPPAAYGLGVILEKLGDRQGARAAMQWASELGHEGADKIVAMMDFEAEAASRIAPLAPGEERLLQTVNRADGNRNDIYLAHRRPSDPETMGTNEPINFIAVIRATDDPDDGSPKYAWQRGPTEISVYRAVAEAFVNVGVLPGTTVTLAPDLQWFVDRIREERGPSVSPAETTNKWVALYVAACGEVLSAANACLDAANRAIGARGMAAKRPQHEISIRNFAQMAEEAEQEFAPIYQAFEEACTAARNAASELLAGKPDPVFAEMALAMANEQDVLDKVATAKGILGASYGPTPAAFVDGVNQANALIQNPPDEGNIYRPRAKQTGGGIVPPGASPSGLVAPDAATGPQSDERTCPWCAETIKAAAVICRFCGRDVDMQPNVG